MDLDLREDFFLRLLADYVLFNEILVGQAAEICLQKLGHKIGLNLEERYLQDHGKQDLTTREFAEIATAILNKLGGNYYLKTCSEQKIELIATKCPFGHLILKSPSLCKVAQSILGGIAARHFSYCKIVSLHTRARKDSFCRLVIFLQETKEAQKLQGQVFSNQPSAYVLTQKEIKAFHNQFGGKQQSTAGPVPKEQPKSRKQENQQKSEENNRPVQVVTHNLGAESLQPGEILSSLQIGVLSVDENLEITYLNQTAKELLQINEQWDSLPGRKFRKILSEAIKTKRHFNQHVLQLPLDDGTRYYSVNAAPIFSAGGKVTGAVSVFQDVTETKTRENELLQMEKFSLVAELAAGTAHEIRNPMTTLRGFLQILLQEFEPNTRGYEYCKLMINEIDRANSIIKEFLLLTKPAAPVMQKVQLHNLLDEIFLLIESKSLLENVELCKNYMPSLPLVEADPAQIKQVFLNIATNAIQAMPNGGKLTISTETRDNMAVVRFTDTGCGLDESQISKIFDPFYTTKEEGTGLGLTISYRIIENHWGRIYVDSVPQKGTTFTIELPASKD